MRLYVGIETSNQGVTNYSIEPEIPKGQAVGRIEDLERLFSLKSRIEAMARRQLGKQFHSLNSFPSCLELRVKAGTSKGKKKFELRDLFGWICLFDAEEG